MHTQTSAEYWHRSGSLVHTTPDGKADAEIPDSVRIYAFGGCQHGAGDGVIPEPGTPRKGIAEYPTSPADYRPFVRALIVALDAWVKDGKEPPASVYPRISARTLVDWHRDKTGFPDIPGMRYPTVIQQPPFADYGPRFFVWGIITLEPPQVKGQYDVLVPKSDKWGLDEGTLDLPDVAVPLATYVGWNLRNKEAGAEGALATLLGSCILFPRTEAEQAKNKDPRPALDALYANFEQYRSKHAILCKIHQDGRTLLAEDAALLMKNLEGRRKLFAAAEGR
jgi:hypothetical protein